jgi:hypothetical protein
MGSLSLENFATGSVALTRAHRAQIDDLAETILRLRRQYPSATLTVIGYYSEAHFTTLGQQRADAVRDALVAAGVPAEIISTDSRFESGSRRVEVIFQPEPLARLDIPPLEPGRPPRELPQVQLPQGGFPSEPESSEERAEDALQDVLEPFTDPWRER